MRKVDKYKINGWLDLKKEKRKDEYAQVKKNCQSSLKKDDTDRTS